MHRLLDESDTTPGQMKALLSLADHDEAISVGELAHDLRLSLPTVSRIVDGLTRRGWVERRVCLEDRRARHLVMTEAGRELVRSFARARASDVRVFVNQLSAAQRRRLGAALAGLVDQTSAVA